jgi:hypothetical protein
MTVIRWPGKPTSGRYVYGNGPHKWSWQCDLHEDLADDELSPGGYGNSMQEAFAAAMAHAAECPFDNRSQDEATA